LGQSALLGWLISSFYKAFTGRVPPPHIFGQSLGALADISNQFQFGFLKGGIFWGWPSSHTTVAFAMGAAFFVLAKDKKWLRWIGLVWALYVGLSVSVSIHWFSEFVAGAIIGSVIGLVVGKAFANKK
ncbi:MAG TPA: phosphatase PAP2 family protein, partial [Nitrososphaera sp.]|nr:phosphatase PAP2 family protein [Nitrososphaera sp.]